MRKNDRMGLRPSGKPSLPDYSFWEIGGHSWGEAVWSLLHGQPIRYGIIPNRAAEILNLWGPNGHLKNSRFNRNL